MFRGAPPWIDKGKEMALISLCKHTRALDSAFCAFRNEGATAPKDVCPWTAENQLHSAEAAALREINTESGFSSSSSKGETLLDYVHLLKTCSINSS